MPVSSKYNKHWPTSSVDRWVLQHNGHKNCLQMPFSLKGAHLQTYSFLDPAPHVRACVASTRILSGFSSFEMWSHRRASREHTQARRSRVCWWPDKDLTPAGSRRTSGPGADCARSWPHCAGVGRTRGLRKEAEPRASVSTPQGQQVPRGNTQTKSHLGLQGRSCINLSRSRVTRTLSPMRAPRLAGSCLSLPGSDSRTRQACPWGCARALGTTGPCWTPVTHRKERPGHRGTPISQEALHLRFFSSPSARVLPGRGALASLLTSTGCGASLMVSASRGGAQGPLNHCSLAASSP